MYLPQTETSACGVGLHGRLASMATPRRDVVDARDRGAARPVAPRRGRCRRQDRRRRRHSAVQIPQEFFKRHVAPHRPTKSATACWRWAWSSCRAPIWRPRNGCARSSSPRSSGAATAFMAGVRSRSMQLGNRRQGERHPAGDRTDHGGKCARGRATKRFEADLFVIRRRIEKAPAGRKRILMPISAR